MLEALIATGLLLAMAGAALAATAAPEALVGAGVWITAGGLAFGIPAGAVYHWALQRSLRRTGRLPDRWWLHPTALHARIEAADRRWVLGWCFAGALGFLVTVLGLVAFAVGALRVL